MNKSPCAQTYPHLMRWFYHMSALSTGQGDSDAGGGSSFESKDVGRVSRGQPTWYKQTLTCLLILIARNFQLLPFGHMPFLFSIPQTFRH